MNFTRYPLILASVISAFADPESPDNLKLIETIRETIIEKSSSTKEEEMKNYSSTIPSTGVSFEMIALQGGEFKMGSAETEKGRKEDEGPIRKIAIAPFWMGKCEITWDEYQPFMITQDSRKKDGSLSIIPKDAPPTLLVSQPTSPYVPMDFGMGIKGFPAISMTQHAALKYCEWLSAQTGHFYRLPTEAEWEYACRAGTETTYSWGNESSEADEYGWFYDNSNGKSQPVGKKKPNPWGLHDMHGNVLEWTLDGYASYPKGKENSLLQNPLQKPTANLYPRVTRGGSWYDDPPALRSAARFKSSPAWKAADPQIPKSIWYHTSALWLGFRIVRPLETPSAEEMHAIWNSGRGLENEL